MKPIGKTLCVFFAITLSLAGQTSVPKTTAETEGPAMLPGFFNTTVGFTIGTYKSPDSRFNEVYGANTSLQFGLNLLRTLIDIRGFQVDLSLEARTLSKTGKATLSGEEAKLSLIPLTAAGRLLYQAKSSFRSSGPAATGTTTRRRASSPAPRTGPADITSRGVCSSSYPAWISSGSISTTSTRRSSPRPMRDPSSLGAPSTASALTSDSTS
jgi:hypothetical protein